MAYDYAQAFNEAQMRADYNAEEAFEREAAMKYCYAQGTLADLTDLLAEGVISRDEVLEIIQADIQAEIEAAGHNQQELF